MGCIPYRLDRMLRTNQGIGLILNGNGGEVSAHYGWPSEGHGRPADRGRKSDLDIVYKTKAMDHGRKMPVRLKKKVSSLTLRFPKGTLKKAVNRAERCSSERRKTTTLPPADIPLSAWDGGTWALAQ